MMSSVHVHLYPVLPHGMLLWPSSTHRCHGDGVHVVAGGSLENDSVSLHFGCASGDKFGGNVGEYLLWVNLPNLEQKDLGMYEEREKADVSCRLLKWFQLFETVLIIHPGKRCESSIYQINNFGILHEIIFSARHGIAGSSAFWDMCMACSWFLTPSPTHHCFQACMVFQCSLINSVVLFAWLQI